MYQTARLNVNTNMQSKKLWWAGMNITVTPNSNDFYEPRVKGRVFANTGSVVLEDGLKAIRQRKFPMGGKCILVQVACSTARVQM